MQTLKLNKKLLTVGIISIVIILIICLFSPFGTSDTSLFLKLKLASEKSTLEESLKGNYSFLYGLEIKKLLIIKNNKYLGATFSYEGATYRALLIRKNDSWVVHSTPSLILAYSDFPDVPKEVIKTINNM